MRTQRVLTRVTSGVAGSVLLLTMAACGGNGTETADDTPAGDTASSATTETEESPAPEETEETPAEEVDGGYSDDELLDAMKAAIAEAESAHVTMEINGDGQSIMSGEGDVSYAGDSTAMQMSMTVAGMGTGGMEIRMVDGVMYMAIPGMTPEGKFMKIDTDDPNSPMGDLGNFTGGDPLATFDAFDAGLQDVKYVGAEDVEGEQMDHYVLTVDAKKAAKAQGQEWQKGMPDTISYDMWLDGDDLMRRIEFDMGAIMGGQSGSGGMVMTMSDWGKPVSVTAPPAKDLMDMPKMPQS